LASPLLHPYLDQTTGKTLNSFNAQISDVQVDGSWIEVYDGNGKEISSMSSRGRDLVGVASSFFVVVKGSWIITYDKNCKEIASMSSSGRTVRGAAGSSFTVEKSSWIITYDKYCKEKSSRSK